MTDRELLELAAKAIGMDIEFFGDENGFDCVTDEQEYWNPLTDDGDALRLSVQLHIDILHRFCGGARVEALAPGGRVIAEYCHVDTRGDATRTAIVRAAAEIGKAVK